MRQFFDDSFDESPLANILVIEDNPDEQLIMQFMMRQHFQELMPVGASSAVQAMTYLGNCQQNHLLLPNLILLDLYLPDRERGWWVLKQVRRQATFQSLPVVVISRSKDPFDINESYRFGANSYISKPTTAQEWSACFETLRQYWWNMALLPFGAKVPA